MKHDNLLTIACEVLECGGSELERLEDVHEDMEAVIFDLFALNLKINYNNIMDFVFMKGISRLEEALEDRIRELESIEDPSAAELEELETLEHLDPESDVNVYIDGIATQVGMSYNTTSIYRKYLQGALDKFEYYTGFCLY